MRESTENATATKLETFWRELSGCRLHCAAGRFRRRQPLPTTKRVNEAVRAANVIKGSRTGAEWKNDEPDAATVLPTPSKAFTAFPAISQTQAACITAVASDTTPAEKSLRLAGLSLEALDPACSISAISIRTKESRKGFNPS